MCLIGWVIADCGYPRWIASNRDESWDRPTQPLHVWALPNGVRVCGGRDGVAGGSWLAVADNGRLAMLTNVRAWPPEPPRQRSRGDLVLAWLSGADADWAGWASRQAADAVNGCNVVLADVHRPEWVWLSNRPQRGDQVPLQRNGWHGRRLGPGVYTLSNAVLDTPWPKQQSLAAALHQALGIPHSQRAWSVLEQGLQQYEAGASIDEHIRRSAFVHLPQRRWGTRSRLMAHWQDDCGLTLCEQTYVPQQGVAVPDGPPRCLTIDWWGMPTSSYGSPSTCQPSRA
ncbi:Transport and Golgi organization 2 [Tepidimonas charontis]|uniref:Transport and Golgi organization 2 n=1 Tax=Tepidimonas charontis TaxID=2267262 RepID=A0A554XIC1_9BURK|nr:Transport and Golgi organization 2 [Tepidimonas charontis]